MKVVRMGIPEKIAKAIADKYQIDIFIETGTFKAKTAQWASTVFEKVYTIEANQAIYEQAKQKNSDCKNISFLQGHSRKKLVEVINILQSKKAMVWLDAHWSGGETYGEKDECPLMDELDILLNCDTNHIILVDDARLFLAPPPKPHDRTAWPNLVTVMNKLKIHHYNAIIYEDVIFAYPSQDKLFFEQYFQKITTKNWVKYGHEPETNLLNGIKIIIKSLIHGKFK